MTRSATGSQALRSFSTAILFALLPLACGEGEVGGGQTPSSVTPQSVAAPQVSFKVESYGARADGRTDSTAALQNAINAAVASGKPAEVVLAAGTYLLSCAGPASSTTADWCLWISNARNLTIRGQGAGSTHLLIANPLKGLLWSGVSAGLALRSFSVDYATLPFTQGTIVAVYADPSQNAFDVELAAGYPGLDQPVVGSQATRAGTAFGMIFEATRPRLKDGVVSYFYGMSSTQLSASTWRVTLDPGNNGELAKIAPGDRYVVAARLSPVLVLWNSSDVELNGVAIYSGPGNATVISHITGTLTVDGFQVQRKPGTDRLLSTGADALHLIDVPARLSITRCTINGMGDDAINIYTQGNTVASVQGQSTLSFQPMAMGIAAGHTVQILDLSTKTTRGVAKIASYTLGGDGKTVTLVLDRAVAGLRAGDTLYDVDLAAPGAEISGNSFDSFRGFFRLRSSGARFVGNTILDAGNARILIDADAVIVSGQTYWNEGPSLLSGVAALDVSGNQVTGGQVVLVNSAGATIPVAATGYVDGIGGITAGGDVIVAGWACLKGLEATVRVDLFAGGAYGTGSYITSTMADAPREAGVGASCGTASSQHGFYISISAAMRKTYAGKAIYIHAIDEHGNPLLYNSGTFVIP